MIFVFRYIRTTFYDVYVQGRLSSTPGFAEIPAPDVELSVKDKLEQLEKYNGEWAEMKREID